jgi:hypothetical protein
MRGGVSRVKIALREAEHSGQKARRKTLNRGVVIVDLSVDGAAGRRNLFFDFVERALQTHKILRRLKFGITFGDRQQTPDEWLHLRVDLGALGGRCALRAVSHRGHGFERFALVLGVTLHRRHEIGNEIETFLQIGIERSQRVVDVVAFGDEAVIQPNHQNN